MAAPQDAPSARVRTVRRFASAAEADRHDLEYWLQLTPAERVLLAWELSQELWTLSGQQGAHGAPRGRGVGHAGSPRCGRGGFGGEAPGHNLLNPDFLDLLRAFVAADVRFLVVGAYALALHGRPRATGDLDVWVDATPANAVRVMSALTVFGAPMEHVAQSDFATPGITLQIGVPPRRIDLLTTLTALTFDDAWTGRSTGDFGGIDVPFIGRAAFIRNKRAIGRPKDLADIEGL